MRAICSHCQMLAGRVPFHSPALIAPRSSGNSRNERPGCCCACNKRASNVKSASTFPRDTMRFLSPISQSNPLFDSAVRNGGGPSLFANITRVKVLHGGHASTPENMLLRICSKIFSLAAVLDKSWRCDRKISNSTTSQPSRRSTEPTSLLRSKPANRYKALGLGPEICRVAGVF